MFKKSFSSISKKISTVTDSDFVKSMSEKITDSVDSATDSMKDISIPTKNYRIAITGLSRAGKTVFITSLIDQLINQGKISYLTEGRESFKAKIKPPKAGISRFDYYNISENIKKNSTWPNGTDSISCTIIEIEQKSKYKYLPNNRFNIELIDYPGEWILDLSLLEDSYSEWSENVLNWLKNVKEDVAKSYLNTIKNITNLDGDVDEMAEKLHKQYSKMLRYLKDNNYSSLTPGRFLMPADMINDPILLFAPIPKDSPDLYQLFRSRYKKYKKDVVRGIHLEYFKDFDRQIVLVDVVKALQNGHYCYADMKKGLDTMLSIYTHGNKNIISQWFKPSIKKVVFVATKTDLVAASQHNNYSQLLSEMTESIRKKLDVDNITTDTQVVASIKCTQSVIKKYDGHTLSYVRGYNNDKKEVEIYPGEMPSSFPLDNNWNAENYDFKSFLPPQKSYKDNESFDHIHMDRVIASIMEDLL